LAQTYNNLEVIVCDDHSSDDSLKRIGEIALMDKRVRVVALDSNSGLPAVPRNQGIKMAQGEWLAFLDSDDKWHPEKLERQLEALKRSGLKACSTNAAGSSGSRLLTRANDRLTFSDLLADNKIITSSFLVQRSVLAEAAALFPESIKLKAVEDYVLWLKLATITDICFIAAPLVDYSENSPDSVRSSGLLVFLRQRRWVLGNLIWWLIGRKKFVLLKTVIKAYGQNEIDNLKVRIKFILKKN
jgi:teichuronic acid biosynthesis glycosyltransferase TuaG